jgi:prepilin-type processing-associated H-X9-DG protein
MNGSPYEGVSASLKKVSGLLHPVERFLWIEENDDNGENRGAWVMQAAGTPTATPPFSDAKMLDGPAAWHGTTSTFNFADGHAENHKWQDAPMIDFAKKMDPNKFQNPPTFSQCPHDIYFLANGYASTINP